MNSMEKANATGTYIFLALTVFVGMAGVFIRFLDEIWGHGFLFTSLSNVVLIIGIIMALKAVFSMLGDQK